MTDPNDKYLFLAYSLLWIVFMLYAWSLARREARLRADIGEIKKLKASKESSNEPDRV